MRRGILSGHFDDIIQSSGMLVVDDWVGCSKRGNLASAVRRDLLTRSSVQWELPDLVARGGSAAECIRLPTVVMIGLGALDVAIAKELLSSSKEPRLLQLPENS